MVLNDKQIRKTRDMKEQQSTTFYLHFTIALIAKLEKKKNLNSVDMLLSLFARHSHGQPIVSTTMKLGRSH